MLYAIGTEPALEKIDDARVFELTGLHLKQLSVRVNSRKPASRSLRSAAGTSGCGGIAENFSVSSFLSVSPILIPRLSASIFITAATLLHGSDGLGAWAG